LRAIAAQLRDLLHYLFAKKLTNCTKPDKKAVSVPFYGWYELVTITTKGMNDEITYRIEQYPELDTNYAIIINGDYGIGKTHYIKNQTSLSTILISLDRS